MSVSPGGDDELVALSALQHYLYCPRQCALIHIEQAWSENRFTAGRIREFGKTGLLLMALTASAAMTSQECKLKGMDDFIIKPVDASGFEEKLLKYFTPE